MLNLSYEVIGERLRIAREKNSMTQTEAASYLGVKREVVSYYETGKRPIDIITLSKLADIYGYSLNFFLNKEEIQVSEKPVMVAFRAENLTEGDLKTVAWAKKFVMNLDKINKMLEGG